MKHLEVFKKYISSFLAVPTLEWPHIIKLLGVRRIKKNEYYFREGQPFDEIGLVAKGLLYNFYTNKDGAHHVKNFICEGELCSPYSDLIQNSLASYSCQALETAHLITLKYQDLVELYKRHSCWEKMGRLNVEKIFIEKEKRERMFLIAGAKERYSCFVAENRQLVNRVPQYLIASYIGLSATSLSRLRKEI